MSRPATGRRIDVRRANLYDGARAFNPLVDPDLIGAYFAVDATDNGTTLTVPNRVAGGTALTATGVGRATISPTGIPGALVGIDPSVSTVPLITAGASLNGRTAFTCFFVGYDPTVTLSMPWRYGNGNQNAATFYNNGARRFDQTKADDLGTNTMVSSQLNGTMQAYTRVMCFRQDIDATPREILPVWMDNMPLDTASYTGPADTTGTFATGPWSIGSNTAGTSPFKGVWSHCLIVQRALTDAEVLRWSNWLRAFVATAGATEMLWTGDSITVGGATAGFRAQIQTLYAARAESFQWYRTIGPTLGAVYAQDYSFAASGRKIEDATALVPSVCGASGLYRNATLIPIMLGTNNVPLGIAGMPALYDALLDAFHAALPGVLLVAQACIPRFDAYAADNVSWNTTLETVVVPGAVSRGINVIFDDTAYLCPGVTYAGTVHPDAAGYVTLGNALEPAMRTWAGMPP